MKRLWLIPLLAAAASAHPPTFTEMRDRLPAPFYDAKPDWIDLYWKAWEFAFRNFYEPPPASGFVSPFIDAAFNANIFFWDTCFMTMFTNVAHPLVPGIGSLDNFYAKQHPDGEICREIVRATGQDFPPWVNRERRPLFSRWGWDGFVKGKPVGSDAPVVYIGRRPPSEIPYLTMDALDHPIAAWAELESFRYTGDRARLAKVRKPLEAYYEALDKFLKQGNGLYLTDWACMDDSPRNPYLKGGGTGIDISSEMALFSRDLARIASLLGDDASRRRFEHRAREISRVINRRMWDPQRQFYFDLTAAGLRAPVKTIAGFWPLLAGVASPQQAAALAASLAPGAPFGTRHRVPTCASDEPGYRAGVYWQGAVWAPTNTMVIRGLERYGHDRLAREIALEHLDTAAATFRATGTIWENYSPDGPARGRVSQKDFVGWSGIGPILYLLEYGIGLHPDAAHNRLEWRVAPGVRSGCRHYRFNGHVVDLAAAPDGKISVESDGDFELRVIRASAVETISVAGEAHSLKKIFRR